MRGDFADEATVYFLERDGWRDPRDVLTECSWCGLSYWKHFLGRGGDPALRGTSRRFCSVGCRDRKAYWFRRAARRRREVSA